MWKTFFVNHAGLISRRKEKQNDICEGINELSCTLYIIQLYIIHYTIHPWLAMSLVLPPVSRWMMIFMANARIRKYMPVPMGSFRKSGTSAVLMSLNNKNWVVVSNIFYFHPYLGKWSNLTNIFQMGWNHQPDEAPFSFINELKWAIIGGVVRTSQKTLKQKTLSRWFKVTFWYPNWGSLNHSKMVTGRIFRDRLFFARKKKQVFFWSEVLWWMSWWIILIGCHYCWMIMVRCIWKGKG